MLLGTVFVIQVPIYDRTCNASVLDSVVGLCRSHACAKYSLRKRTKT